MLKMDLEYNRGILFVRLDGSLNRRSSYKLNSYLVPILLKHRVKYLVYNLYNLYGVDESGLDAILNTKCAIKVNKGKIYMCEVNSDIKPNLKRLRINMTKSELTAFDLIRV